MLPYYGKPSNLEGFPATPKNLRRATTTLILRGRNEKQLTPKSECNNIRRKTLRQEEKIRINVSGRRYDISLQQLHNFPKSLLADPAKRELFHDAENNEIFFDRNRTTFESVYYFYATSGMLVFPTKSFSQQLVADELYFFGLYDYLSPEEKHYSLPIPSALSKKRVLTPRASCQKTFWEMCEFPESSPVARVLNLFSLVVIVFAVVLLCIDSLPSVRNSTSSQDVSNTHVNQSSITNQNSTHPTHNNTSHVLKNFVFGAEQFCIAWFTLEFLARFVASPEKRRFLCKFLNIVDVTAILPFYIFLIASRSYNVRIHVIKIFHLSKIFQVLKITRYTSTMKVLGKTAKACLSDLWTVVFLTFIGTVLFGSVVFYCEQWDKGTEFHSIPDACWWAVVTITTLGYGDLVPSTLAGKIVGGACSISGVVLITPLLPIIFNKFNRFQKLEDSKILSQCRPTEEAK
ncbi:hypothetical protein ACROYT_G023764 [Oculina patagonica]